MSGGVDSSVAAALLKKQGYNVVGVFMRPWSPDREIRNTKHKVSENSSDVSGFMFHDPCLWQQDREDAMRAAAVLEIPLLTWDFSREYKKEVTDYMIREYRAGRTPNPDVMCNKYIKFGLFLKKALKEGADFIATGHYVRLRKFQIPNHSSCSSESEADRLQTSYKSQYPNYKRAYQLMGGLSAYGLFMAKDKNKDQSYFLWTLMQKQLKYCLFPIGDYIKPEIRKMAKKFGLPNHDKKDSQGVCFIGPLDMKDFLKRYIKQKSGKIINRKGNIVGHHDGVYYYTIGQRHGLNITNGQGPYFVTGKDIKKNIIYVGREEDLGGKEAKIANINWINGQPKLPAEVNVKTRYRSKSEKAILLKNKMTNPTYVGFVSRISRKCRCLTLKFLKPVRAITPGQSAVFYRGEEMLGGGTIDISG